MRLRAHPDGGYAPKALASHAPPKRERVLRTGTDDVRLTCGCVCGRVARFLKGMFSMPPVSGGIFLHGKRNTLKRNQFRFAILFFPLNPPNPLQDRLSEASRKG